MNNLTTINVSMDHSAVSTQDIIRLIDNLQVAREPYAECLAEQLAAGEEDTFVMVGLCATFADAIRYWKSILDSRNEATDVQTVCDINCVLDDMPDDDLEEADYTVVKHRVLNLGGGTEVLFIDVHSGGVDTLLTFYDDSTLHVFPNITSTEYTLLDDPGVLDYEQLYDFYTCSEDDVHSYSIDMLRPHVPDECIDEIIQIVHNYNKKYNNIMF